MTAAQCVVAHGVYHGAIHSTCAAGATGETLVRSAYIGWVAALPNVPSVSPKSVPLA
jgi:hypothetical protein